MAGQSATLPGTGEPAHKRRTKYRDARNKLRCRRVMLWAEIRAEVSLAPQIDLPASPDPAQLCSGRRQAEAGKRCACMSYSRPFLIETEFQNKECCQQQHPEHGDNR